MKYNENEKTYIWLAHFEFINNKKFESLLNLVETPSDLLFKFNENLKRIEEIVGSKNVDKMIQFDNLILERTIENLEKSNVLCVTQISDLYPEKLMEIESPPFILFCKGDITLLKEENCIAIVGARTPTTYGKQITEMFAKGLSENGFAIVSGLAYGVDTVAHSSTIEVGGKTIAVLGGGFNHIYPAQNTNLFKEIEKTGLVVSEYPPSTKPTSYSFPLRNRIIAGLSKGVLITEASEKSGSLHTKEYALDCGRDVFAVPGNITSAKSFGTNRIIKSASVACVTEVEDIVSVYGKKVNKIKKELLQLDIIETQIVNLVANEEKSFDLIQIQTNLDVKVLNRYLTTLQLRGIITKLPGNMFIKI